MNRGKGMNKQKFTFKTIKPTGRYRSFYPDQHEIKLKRKTVGSIEDKKHHRISLMVEKEDIYEEGNPNCSWKWIMLSEESESITDAKDFLNKHIKDILKKYKLHKHEPFE